MLFLQLTLAACAPTTEPISVAINSSESSLVRVCPASTHDAEPPSFTALNCVVAALKDVNPQSQHIWVLYKITVAASERERLIGLRISAKASSLAYLNGKWLGANGNPGDDANSETVGKMDAVIAIPQGLLKVGENLLALRMSSHNGWLQLDNPIHAIALVDYLNQQDQILRRYLPALLPLGAFLLAGFYFASLALRYERKAPAAWLTALSLLAALQLLIESSRGVFAYRYPLHDVRLIGIMLCSLLIAACLIAIAAKQFTPKAAQRGLIIGASITMAAIVLWIPGMDGKASLLLILASAFSLGFAIYGISQRIPHAGAHAIVFALFGALNVWAQRQFLDLYLFYLIAALLVFLMTQQAGAFARATKLQHEQRARADRLQAALDEREQSRSELTLSIVSLGKVRRIVASSIAHIQAAGDYTELHLSTGESVLHAVGLAELEAQLSNYFLRVHRSHIVNTRLIDRLQQAEGGTGTLFMQNGAAVPVSRRTMPGVRKALR